MLWQRGVVNTVVVLGSSGVGLVVYRREEGEETMNTMHDMTKRDARCALKR